MAFIGNIPTNVPLTGSQIADGTIVNANVATNTLNLTQKVTSTLPFANGGTGLSALGTANQVLAVNSGATALEYQTVSSDYVLLATSTANNTASTITMNGYFSSTYKNYVVKFNNILPATNRTGVRLRVRIANADVTSGYAQIGWNGYVESVGSGISTVSAWFSGTYADINGDASNTSSQGGSDGEIVFFNPSNSSQNKNFYLQSIGWKPANDTIIIQTPVFYRLDNTAAFTGFTIYTASGNITSGTVKLYGIK